MAKYSDEKLLELYGALMAKEHDMICTRIDHIALVEGNSEICLKSLSGAEAETFFNTYLNAKGVNEMQRAFDNGDLETTYHNGELTLVIYI